MDKLGKLWYALKIIMTILSIVSFLAVLGVFIYFYIKGAESLGPLLASLIKGNK